MAVAHQDDSSLGEKAGAVEIEKVNTMDVGNVRSEVEEGDEEQKRILKSAT